MAEETLIVMFRRKVLVAQSCLTLCDPMDCIAHQAPLSMEFSWQEYWSVLPLPTPRDLLNPGIKPKSPAPPVLTGGFCYHYTTWEAPAATIVNI